MANSRIKAKRAKIAAAEVQAVAEKAVSEVQTAAKKAVEKKDIVKAVAEEKKVEVKAAAEKTKKAVKKTKKDIKVNAYVEYYGKQVHESTMIAEVKKAWRKSGHKVGDIKSMDLYIKPEEDRVYYVINGTENGSIAF